MSDTVIRIDNLTKEYKLGVISHRTLYRDVQSRLSRLLNREDPNSQIGADLRRMHGGKFQALNNISLEIKQGDVVGIIGKNGAGKSTLLKILCRITVPTKGEVRIKGRIASLLEVGTGFHPELTGRENIYLNGAILGMRKKEITVKFDEIVSFSGVEEFIDTPVKRYSSGMYVRLAFAVAAHLRQEILIVDEVLAVGDIDFQKKCLNKMESVSKMEGRTVLFVSHNMAAISSMCTRGVFIKDGKMNYDGSIDRCVKKYMQYDDRDKSQKIYEYSDNVVEKFARLYEVYIKNKNGTLSRIFDFNEEITIGIVYEQFEDVSQSEYKPYPQINITSSRGDTVFAAMPSSGLLQKISSGKYLAECKIPSNYLNIDTYFISVGMAHVEKGVNVAFFEEMILSFEITEDILERGMSIRNGYLGPMPGVIRPLLDWTISKR